MADATNTVTVDGVEPSISVRLLNVSDNPERVKIATDDSGAYRYLEKDAENPTLVTVDDLSKLGSFAIQIENNDETEPDTVVVAPAVNPAGVVKSSPVTPISPGQSGQ